MSLWAISNTALAQTAVPSIVIETKPLREVLVQPEREALATIVSRNESKLSTEVAGTVMRWGADLGAAVKKGETLVVLDPADAQLAVQRAQTAIDAASVRTTLIEAQVNRARELQAKGFISPDALLQRETELQLIKVEQASARNGLASAQRALAKTTIRAPFAGVVKQRNAQVGETVAPGALLYVIVERGTPELAAMILPGELTGLRKASGVAFATQGATFPVTFARVASTISATARTQEVRFKLPADSDVVVGAEGTLRWRDANASVPAQYVVKRGNALGLFVDQGGKAKFVPVPGAQEGRSVSVTMPAETKLIVRGQATLQDGQALK